MKIMIAILVFIAYHGLNIFLAWWNVEIVMSRIARGKRKQIEHFWWFLGYCLICFPMYYIYSVWFALAVIPPHLSIFAPYYNHYRGFAPFNLSKTSNAITEKLMVRMRLKDIETACFVAEFIAIVLFTISLLKI